MNREHISVNWIEDAAEKIVDHFDECEGNGDVENVEQIIKTCLATGFGSQAISDLPELLQALCEGRQIQAKHIRDDQWVFIESWEDGVDFVNFQYRSVT